MRKAILGIFIFISFLIFRPILNNLWYPMHDSTSVARVYLLGKTLASGQFPAIWASEVNDGAGYPLFHFYAPLMTYTALAFRGITGSYFFGIKLTLFLTSLLGLIGMYFLTRRWGGVAGVVSAISYALLPYAAVNLYVRGAFAEYLAMGILPWVFYVWMNLTSLKRCVLAAIVTTLFLLSHNLIPLITFPFLLVWIILNRPPKLISLILSAILTICLSSFYLLPLLFERNFVQADAIAKTTDYSLHFVAPTQLWNSAWGYGGSAAGVEDGMSFKVGKIQLLLALLSTILIVARSKRKELFFVFAGLLSLFMTTSYSAFLWAKIPLLPIVQFPWRFLVLGGFFVSILAGYTQTFIRHKLLQLLSAVAIVILLLFLSLKYFTPQTTFVSNQTDFTSQSYLNTLPSIVPEYAPYWLTIKNKMQEGYTVLPYLYYPTWEVKLDGQKTGTVPASGHLAFYNPTGSTNYSVSQGHTALEQFALGISLITLLIMIGLYVKS